MTSFKEIFGVHLKYLEYLVARSLLSHQYVKNPKLCGDDVESEIRLLFQSFLPQRFKVTHGYILSASTSKEEPIVSPQVDMIIVDTMVAHSIFPIGKENGMEVVPVESIVGFFELKRTLDRESIKDALKHLHTIANEMHIRKDDSRLFLPGGIQLQKPITGGYYSNPIIGVVSLSHEKNLSAKEDEKISEIMQTLKEEDSLPEVDIIASLQGLIYTPISGPQNDLLFEPLRTEPILNHGIISTEQGVSQKYILSRIFGFVLAYLQCVCGRQLEPRRYYFNDSIERFEKNE